MGIDIIAILFELIVIAIITIGNIMIIMFTLPRCIIKICDKVFGRGNEGRLNTSTRWYYSTNLHNSQCNDALVSFVRAFFAVETHDGFFDRVEAGPMIKCLNAFLH